MDYAGISGVVYSKFDMAKNQNEALENELRRRLGVQCPPKL